MRLRKKESNAKGRTVLVLADCLHGAMAAGRFAVRNLRDSDSRILLLQTYRKPGYGQSMLRDISPILEKVAKAELTELKNQMMKEFDLSAGSIGKATLEGDIRTVLKNWFGNTPGLSVVVGSDPRLSYRSFPCRKVIEAVVESGLTPVFVVSDSITLIDREGITLFAGEEKEVSSDYFDFLKEISGKYELRMTIITVDSENSFFPSGDTTLHLSVDPGSRSDNITGGEMIFRKEVEKMQAG
ncbi:MAG: hypothetical protein LC649_09805 [Bacteroidales bacterium]|nr:hypothetical protein [Bacteroidales bacterium]